MSFVCQSSELTNPKEPWKTLNVKPVFQMGRGPGTPKVQLAPEVRAVLLGTMPSNLWGELTLGG